MDKRDKGPRHFMQMYGSDMRSKLTPAPIYQIQAKEAEKMVREFNEYYSHIESLHRLIADMAMNDLEGNEDTVGTATTVKATKESVSMVDVIAAIETLPNEPLREYMIEQGNSPDDGWTLVIPMPMRVGAYLPPYVIASRYIAEPFFIKPDYHFKLKPFTGFEI